MRPLNRPMFRYGGPIKEGIMQGMKDGGLSKQFNTGLVGDERYPKTSGREHHAFFLAPLAMQGIMAGARMLAPRAIAAGAKAFGRGLATPSGAPSVFGKGLTIGQRLKSLIPSGRFREAGSKIPLGGKNPKNLPVPFGSTMDATTKLSLRQSLTDPRRLGMAIRENPATAFLAAGQIKNIPDAISGGVGLAADAGLGGVNYLLGTDFSRDKKGDLKTTDDGTGVKRGDPNKNKNVASTDTDGTNNKSNAEKQIINEDRINETKQKYYKLMGIDKMNKDAVYDSLINASQIVSEEGADLKGAIRSGTLQNRIIQAIGKNLDKSADLKKAIDSAVLKGEIQKDINLTKPSAFAEQVEYVRNNPDDPLAKKLSGMTSVADNLAALADKPITSDMVARLVTAKGTEIEDIVKDDKYQKWEKNNENKDEIDYLQEITKGGSLDAGIYIVNKKAIRIDEEGSAFPVDLDSIIG